MKLQKLLLWASAMVVAKNFTLNKQYGILFKTGQAIMTSGEVEFEINAKLKVHNFRISGRCDWEHTKNSASGKIFRDKTKRSDELTSLVNNQLIEKSNY